jgi:hypothetical protein
MEFQVPPNIRIASAVVAACFVVAVVLRLVNPACSAGERPFRLKRGYFDKRNGELLYREAAMGDGRLVLLNKGATTADLGTRRRAGCVAVGFRRGRLRRSSVIV